VKFKEVGKGVLNTFGALVILQEVVNIENPVFFNKILDEIESDRFFLKNITEFIGNSHVNKLEDMRKIEGSNYGIHTVGLYDPALLFLHRLLVRLQKENPARLEMVVRNIKENKIQIKINQLVCSLSSKTDLSPRGLISLLMLLYDLLSITIWDEFADEKFFQSLIELLKEQQLETLL
jgi:hypothetical protein